jgi:hypothetical protein
VPRLLFGSEADDPRSCFEVGLRKKAFSTRVQGGMEGVSREEGEVVRNLLAVVVVVVIVGVALLGLSWFGIVSRDDAWWIFSVGLGSGLLVVAGQALVGWMWGRRT